MSEMSFKNRLYQIQHEAELNALEEITRIASPQTGEAPSDVLREIMRYVQARTNFCRARLDAMKKIEGAVAQGGKFR